MNSSRWTRAMGILAAVVVLAGVATGAIAYFAGAGAGFQSGTVSPLFDFVPEGASLIGYVDLRLVASSPLAESWSEGMRDRTPLDEIEESTGIDLLNDVDSLTLAVGAGSAKPERWGIAVAGDFDRDRLIEKISTRESAVETSRYAGSDLYLIRSGTEATAVAQPDDSTLLVGEPAYVREMLDAGAGKKAFAKGNLESWGYGDFAGETFWLAGAPPDFVKGFVDRGGENPSLRSFAVTGRLETDLILRARGRAADPKTAKELADVVRGLVALGRLRQDSSRESAILGEMAQSVSVELADEAIDVSLLVPYDSIRQLLSSQREKASAR